MTKQIASDNDPLPRIPPGGGIWSRQIPLFCGQWCGMRAAMTGMSRCKGYLDEHLCGIVFIAASACLPGVQMSKGTITVKREAKVLPSFLSKEIVQVDGCAFHACAALMADAAGVYSRRGGGVILINRDGNMRGQHNYFEVL